MKVRLGRALAKVPWPKVGVIALLLTLSGVAIYSYADAQSKPDKSDLEREYDDGYDAGYASGESAGETAAAFDADQRVRRVKRRAYDDGWGVGFDAGLRSGAEQAAPGDIDFQTWYITTYEPSSTGPLLHRYTEMPLNTIWICEDLEICTELVP